MRPRLTIVTLVLGATVVLTPAHGAQAAAARCHGERATIVGTARADRLWEPRDRTSSSAGAEPTPSLASAGTTSCAAARVTTRSSPVTAVTSSTGGGATIASRARGAWTPSLRTAAAAKTAMTCTSADRRTDSISWHLAGTRSGGAGHDQVNLFGDVRGVRASGGVGNDRFGVHPDQDITLAGGPGRDRIVVTGYAASADQRLTVDYRVGKIIDTYADSVVTVSSIEATEIRVPDLEHTLAAYFYGTGGDDEISVHGGSLAPLVAFGYRGDDALSGLATGDDTMDGGAGTDRADGDEGDLETCLSIERATSCER